MNSLLVHTFKYLILFIALAMILREAGVDPISMVAGAGLVGIALGFGAQSLVKDVISGFFIFFEGAYSVGDFVCLHLTGTPDVFGMVDEMSLRSTKLQLLDGVSTVVPNGTIISINRYPLGYVPFFITLVFPADIGRKSLKEWLDTLAVDLMKLSKVITDAPRVVEPMELSGGRIMARIKVDLVPSMEGQIDALIQQIKDHFKDTFFQDLPEPMFCELSEGALNKYKSFFAPHESLG
jgi:small conductance mechanosensitive channel